MSRRCFVCGFRSSESVCPRCNTILLGDRAGCPKCGKAYEGWIAACDACAAPMDSARGGPPDDEAVHALASVPGISEERAKALAARGFRDFADLVRLALPESAVRQGLHHTISRRVMLADLVPRPQRQVSGARCPTCGAASLANSTRCAVCGSSFDLELDRRAVEQKLGELTGEVADFASDADVRGMPSDIRNELLEAFGNATPEDVLREECRVQIEAWRTKGFDVAPLERLVEEDLAHFGERSARLIRSQMMTRAESGKYRCPLCEVRLESTAEQCSNCGARFS